MKHYRHCDIWLERGCQLTVVGLSVVAAFLLRFDFAVPASVIPILKQAKTEYAKLAATPTAK